MSSSVIIGLALIIGTYSIIAKILKLIEWNMKYNQSIEDKLERNRI